MHSRHGHPGPWPLSINNAPLIELRRVLPETLLALFTGECLETLEGGFAGSVKGVGWEYHLGGFGERVGFLFSVAFGAVEPFSAWRVGWDGEQAVLRIAMGVVCVAYSRESGWLLGR